MKTADGAEKPRILNSKNQGSSAKRKVLIIEDDKFLLKLYSDKLRRAKFEVIKAVSGEEGLTKIINMKPDLVVLDLVLPGVSGFDILNDIKLRAKTKNIPVVILTNLGQESDIKRGLELGAVDYLFKANFSINKLPSIVRKHLKKSKKK